MSTHRPNLVFGKLLQRAWTQAYLSSPLLLPRSTFASWLSTLSLSDHALRRALGLIHHMMQQISGCIKGRLLLPLWVPLELKSRFSRPPLLVGERHPSPNIRLNSVQARIRRVDGNDGVRHLSLSVAGRLLR